MHQIRIYVMVNIQSNHLKKSRKPNSKPFNLRLQKTIRCIDTAGQRMDGKEFGTEEDEEENANLGYQR